MSAHLFQLQVVEYREQVDAKTNEIYAFTGSETMRTLPLDEQHRLVRQLNLMRQLQTVLDERITAF